jgi:hypothetical protein
MDLREEGNNRWRSGLGRLRLLPRIVIELNETRSDVRFGSKADMCSAKPHVRFTPKADIRREFVNVREVPIAGVSGLVTVEASLTHRGLLSEPDGGLQMHISSAAPVTPSQLSSSSKSKVVPPGARRPWP